MYGSEYIMPRYIHPHSQVPWELRIIILCYDTYAPTLYFLGSEYIMPRYIHRHSLVPWERLSYATIYPPPISISMGIIISCYSMSTPPYSCKGVTRYDNIWWGGDYIVTLYFHSWQYLGGGGGGGVIISWHYIFTSLNLALGVIVFEYLHSPHLTLQSEDTGWKIKR